MENLRSLRQHQEVMIADFQEGETFEQIGMKYGHPPDVIYLFLLRLGIAKQPPGTTENVAEELVKLYHRGWLPKESAWLFYINDETVRRYLKGAGISLTHRRSQKKYFIEDHKEEIITLYQSGYGTTTIGKYYKYPDCIVVTHLKEWGIELRDRVIQVNENFFDNIDNSKKAYVLGFFVGDGCVLDNGFFRISITDLQILEDMARAMEYQWHLTKIPPRIPGHLTQYALSFGSAYVRDQLIRLGAPPRKTYVGTFPSYDLVPKHLMKYWILGLSDADGTITANYKIQRWHSRIVGNASTCFGLQRAVEECCGIKGSVCKVCVGEFHTTWGFTVSGSNLKPYLDWLYEDPPIFLKRKFDKYQEFLLNGRNVCV